MPFLLSNATHVAGVSLVLLLSMLQIGFQVSIRNNLSRDSATFINWPPGVGAHRLASVPETFQNGASNILLVSLSINLAMVVIAIMYGISLHNNASVPLPGLYRDSLLTKTQKSSSRPYRVAYYTALATSLSINIIAFIVATVQTNQSTTWSYTTVYSLGRYTHESWACQMQHNIRQRRSQLGNDCRLAVPPLVFRSANGTDLSTDDQPLACNCDHSSSRWNTRPHIAQRSIEPEKLTAQTELRA